MYILFTLRTFLAYKYSLTPHIRNDDLIKIMTIYIHVTVLISQRIRKNKSHKTKIFKKEYHSQRFTYLGDRHNIYCSY